jgi:hypothetical protein
MDKLEFVTVYRGRDSVMYLADDFYKYGEGATPYHIRQNPSDKAPFVKMKFEDVDAIVMPPRPQPEPLI